MVGGFGLCGIPENLIAALVRKGVKNLHTISNNVGVDEFGLGLMLCSRPDHSHKGSYVGENKLFEEMVLTGEHRARADSAGHARGAHSRRRAPASRPSTRPPGMARWSPKAKRRASSTDGMYVLERALTADFALVKAWKGDRWGNLVYRKTARNFNPMMATAGEGHHRRSRAAGRAGRARSGPGAHAGHLRAADLSGQRIREAHRAAHAAQAHRGAK